MNDAADPAGISSNAVEEIDDELQRIDHIVERESFLERIKEAQVWADDRDLEGVATEMLSDASATQREHTASQVDRDRAATHRAYGVIDLRLQQELQLTRRAKA